MIKPEKLKDVVDEAARFFEANGKTVLQVQCMYVVPWPGGIPEGYIIRIKLADCTAIEALDYMNKMNTIDEAVLVVYPKQFPWK